MGASAAASLPGNLKVLVVDSEVLQAHVCELLSSHDDFTSVVGHQAATARFASQQFDVVLMAVGESILDVMTTAARMRAIERALAIPRRAAIVACTAYRVDPGDDCFPGSALSGILNAPWTRAAVQSCLDKWRGQRTLPVLSTTSVAGKEGDPQISPRPSVR